MNQSKTILCTTLSVVYFLSGCEDVTLGQDSINAHFPQNWAVIDRPDGYTRGRFDDDLETIVLVNECRAPRDDATRYISCSPMYNSRVISLTEASRATPIFEENRDIPFLNRMEIEDSGQFEVLYEYAGGYLEYFDKNGILSASCTASNICTRYLFTESYLISYRFDRSNISHVGEIDLLIGSYLD